MDLSRIDWLIDLYWSGARRASWRIISSIEQKEEHKGSEDKIGLIRVYRDQVTIDQSSRSMGRGLIRIYRDQVTISQSSRSMGSEDKIGLIQVYRDQVTNTQSTQI
jgi:hypothetical protein